MNRPLDFRAWHEPTSRMFYGVYFDAKQVNYVHDEGGSSRIAKDESGDYVTTKFDYFKREDCILMQSTGVLDAKGNMIWEGDILFWQYVDKSTRVISRYYEVVEFRFGTFGSWKEDPYEPMSALCRSTAVMAGGRHYQIIQGNIHQHRHLLNLSGEFPFPVSKVRRKHLPILPVKELIAKESITSK
jgi:uncharacterized phage protein (TIGR01671 family)